VFYLVLVFVFSLNNTKKLLFQYLVLAGAAIESIIAIGGYFGLFFTGAKGTRLIGFSGNPTYLSFYMLLASFLALSMALEAYTKHKKSNFVFWFLGFLYFSAILFGTGTRGNMLGWGVGIFIVLCYLIYRYKRTWVGKCSLIIVLLGIFSVLTLFSLKKTNFVKNNLALSRLTSISVADITAQSRLSSYKVSLKAVPAQPIFGWGLENYRQVFQRNFIPQMVNNPGGFNFDKTHNMPLEILVTTGIIGAVAYISFFCIVFVSLHTKISSKEISPIVGTVLAGGLTGYLIANLFFFDVFESLFMLTIYLALVTPYTPILDKSNLCKSSLRRNSLIILIGTSIFSVSILYKCVLQPYITSYNFYQADYALSVKQYDKACSYLQKSLSKETFVTRDILMYFENDYFASKESMDSINKKRFYDLLKSSRELLVQKHPNSPMLRSDLVFLLTNQSEISVADLSEAKEVAVSLVTWAPNYVPYRVSLASIYRMSNEYDKALQEINQVLSITKIFPQPYWDKGIILETQGKYSEAIDNLYLAVQNGYPVTATNVQMLKNLAQRNNRTDILNYIKKAYTSS